MKAPDRDLFSKKGRGIYRRFFYYIPSSGEGAVNYNVAQWGPIKGSNSLHQMEDVGEPGTVNARERGCHCLGCQTAGGHCAYLQSMLQELTWMREKQTRRVAGRRPQLRGDAEQEGRRLSLASKPGQHATFYVDGDEGWMVAELLHPSLALAGWSQEGEPVMVEGSAVAQVVKVDQVDREFNWMGRLEDGDEVVYVQKLEPIIDGRGAPNRNEYKYTDKRFACFVQDMRVRDIHLIGRLKGSEMLYHLPAKDKDDTLRALALLPDAAPAEAGTLDDTIAALLGGMEEEEDGDAEAPRLRRSLRSNRA